jgi:hypothetical protein
MVNNVSEKCIASIFKVELSQVWMWVIYMGQGRPVEVGEKEDSQGGRLRWLTGPEEGSS